MKNGYAEKIVSKHCGKDKEYLKGGYICDISYILSYYKLCHLAVLFVDRFTSQRHRSNVGQGVQRKPPFFITSRPLISNKSRPHIRKNPAIIQKIRIEYRLYKHFLRKKAKSQKVIFAHSLVNIMVAIGDRSASPQCFCTPCNMAVGTLERPIGRGGRDGSYVLAIMYYRGYHLARCDPTMRTFVKNKTTCRRAGVVNFFSEKCKKPPTLHQCCDVCSEKCDCGSCPTDIFKQSSSNVESKMANFHLSRSVTDNERQTFFELLNDLRDASSQSTSVLGTMYFHETSSLDDEIIECLTRDLEHLFSIDYIMQNFNIVSEILVEKILGVVNDIFSDLKESEFLSQLDFMRLSENENEQFFASVPEQNPSDSSDESVDEL